MPHRRQRRGRDRQRDAPLTLSAAAAAAEHALGQAQLRLLRVRAAADGAAVQQRFKPGQAHRAQLKGGLDHLGGGAQPVQA